MPSFMQQLLQAFLSRSLRTTTFKNSCGWCGRIPLYELPTRQTITKLLSKRRLVYPTIGLQIAIAFKNCLSLSGTTDGTKKNGQSFWTLTLTGIHQHSWQMIRRSCCYDVLKFWRQYSTKFPLISLIALRILPASASQTYSERVFSKLGRIVVDSRPSLDPVTANKLVVVRAFGLAHYGPPPPPTVLGPVQKPIIDAELTARRQQARDESRRRKLGRRLGILFESNAPRTNKPCESAMDVTESDSTESSLPDSTKSDSEDEVESDSDDETAVADVVTAPPFDEQEPKSKLPKLTEVVPSNSRSEFPCMELTVSNEGRDMLVAYFLNVPSNYTPDWDQIFPKHRTCFDSFVDLEQSIPTFTFKLTKLGKKKFRGSRKTVLFELGSIFRLD